MDAIVLSPPPPKKTGADGHRGEDGPERQVHGELPQGGRHPLRAAERRTFHTYHHHLFVLCRPTGAPAVGGCTYSRIATTRITKTNRAASSPTGWASSFSPLPWPAPLPCCPQRRRRGRCVGPRDGSLRCAFLARLLSVWTDSRCLHGGQNPSRRGTGPASSCWRRGPTTEETSACVCVDDVGNC